MSAFVVALFAFTGCGGADVETADSTQSAPAVSDPQLNQEYHECMLAEGIPATLDDQGVVSYNPTSTEMAERYEAAMDTCYEVLDEKYQLGETEEDLNLLYDQMTAAQDCLEKQGVAVDGWPSHEVFIESGGMYPVPYVVEYMSLEEAEALCPAEFDAIG